MEKGILVDMQELAARLDELIACEALELLRCPSRNERDLYIPYMLNDAVEYYYVLHDCSSTGELKKEFDDQTQVDLQSMKLPDGSSKKVLILRSGEGDFTTLVFSECSAFLMLYQYHRIGHFWVKDYVLWRRLVYIIGTVADKYSYLGAAACNPAELSLIPLIHFAPFRFFSPIRESIEGYYEETEEGYEMFCSLAESIGDIALVRKMEEYHRKMHRLMRMSFLKTADILEDKRAALIREMAMEIIKPEHRKLYDLINAKIDSASASYRERDYGDEKNAYIEECRRQTAEGLTESGYEGTYPEFTKEGFRVRAYEEHPFIIEELDYHDFQFRIHLFGEDGKRLEKK